MTGFHFTGTAVHALPELRFPFFRIPGSLGLEYSKKTDVQNEEQRQRLIDCFVNAVFVYDDKIILTFNYKNCTKTIKLSDIKNSDLESLSPPNETVKKLPF